MPSKRELQQQLDEIKKHWESSSERARKMSDALYRVLGIREHELLAADQYVKDGWKRDSYKRLKKVRKQLDEGDNNE